MAYDRCFIYGTVTDCSQAGELIEGIVADYLWADRGYDTDNVIEQTANAKMEAVIKIEKIKENMIKIYMRIVIRLKIVF